MFRKIVLINYIYGYNYTYNDETLCNGKCPVNLVELTAALSRT